MASRDLTSVFMERRSAAMRKRPTSTINNNGLVESIRGGEASYTKLTAGGGGGNHDLMLAEEGDGIQLTDMSNKKNKLVSIGGAQPPAWVNHVKAVEQSLERIQISMEQLQSLHSNRVGSIFGKDLQGMEGRIERLTREITDEFRTSESGLQKVGILTKRAGGQEATVGANIQRSLAKQLQELSVTFRQSQRKYLAEVQAQKSSSNGGAGGSSTSALMGDIGGTRNGNGGVGSGHHHGSNVDARFGIDLGAESGDFFTTQQVAVVDDITNAVQSRDEEIQKIAQSIEELGTIFKELAVLVIDQGTILDRIDYNMETVVDSTKTGIKQLEKAEKHQKSARPMRCIICLSITIFILLLILMLKHRPRRGWF